MSQLRDQYVYFIDNRIQAEVLEMRACVEAMEEAYRAWGMGLAAIQAKTELHSYHEGGYHDWGMMHGVVQPFGIAALRIKSDFHLQTGPTSYGDKHAGVGGQFCGLVLLFNTRNGLPMAILNDAYIQHARVAAGAAVAARYLAREDASTLGILGSGGMARSHAEALCAVRPVRSIRVYSPNAAHRAAFAEEMSRRLGVRVEAKERPEDAVRGSDIVACCTSSTRQAVLSGEWLEPGMHITNVLGAELGADAAARVDYAVKNQPMRDLGSHFVVAGEPPEGVTPRPQGWKPPAVTEDMPLLSDVVLGKAPGRTSPEQITYFSNNEGTGVQFAAAGKVVMERLAEGNFEEVPRVPMAWFVQDVRD